MTLPLLQPGDVVLVKTHHFVSRLIRFGQRSYGKDDAQWNHVAVYVGDGQIVEALTNGVELNRLDRYSTADTLYCSCPVMGGTGCGAVEMRQNAAEFARSCVGEKYGYAAIAAIALKTVTKGRWSFGVQGTTICSGLAARCLERMGYNFNPFDPAELTPAFLAGCFRAESK
jgi:uncharacterized protein YycO